MSEHQRLDHDRLGHLLRFALHHANSFLSTGDYQVKLRLTTFVIGRIDQVFTVDQTYAHTRDGVVEWDVGQIQGTRCTCDGNDVRIIVRVGGNYGGNDLRLKTVAVGEQRTHRPVDQTTGQHFFLTRTALATKVIARYAAR